jgi:hypothetical protein
MLSKTSQEHGNYAVSLPEIRRSTETTELHCNNARGNRADVSLRSRVAVHCVGLPLGRTASPRFRIKQLTIGRKRRPLSRFPRHCRPHCCVMTFCATRTIVAYWNLLHKGRVGPSCSV